MTEINENQNHDNFLEKIHDKFETVEKFIKKFEVEKIHKFINRVDLPDEKVEILSLTTGGFNFSDDGYPYNSFLVDALNNGKVLTIQYMGLTLSYTLHTGTNQINLKSGTTIVPTQNMNLVIVKSVHSMKDCEL